MTRRVDGLSEEVVDAYLRRIGLSMGDVTLDHDGLALLQYSHLTAVPFTNLDVFEQQPVTTDLEWSIPAVLEGRGGWCFVLNGAFAALLSSLGFDVTRYGALVTMHGADPTPMDDHLCLRVDLDEPFLVDVGFGESFTRPLPLSSDEPTFDAAAGRRFRLVTLADGRRQLESEHGAGNARTWRDDYAFAEVGRDLDYFAAANDYLTSTPGLPWTEKRFSTRLTPEGRATLLHDRIKFSPVGAAEHVEPLTDDAAWEAARRRHLPTPS